MLKNTPRGLRPLPVHISMAWAEQDVDLTGAENQKFIEGIQAYLAHPYKRDVPELEVVWQRGEMRVLKCPSTVGPKRSTIVIVPSLINRVHILDITEERSFVRWLAQQGHDVFLCDWGEAIQDEGMATLEQLVSLRLIPALEFVHEQSTELFGIGYCMGGTLLCAAAHKVQQYFAGLIFLASPWDFHAGDRVLQKQISMAAPAALDMIATRGHLPMEWIQSVFAVVNGSRAKDKFIRFANMDKESAKARLFVAVEEWLNDGVSLPGEVAKTCIQGWYMNNETGTDRWQISGEAVKLSEVNVPSLIVASENDRLVPQASSFAIAEPMPHADILSLDCGHIGMITGRRAESDMWKPVHDWISSQS